MTEDPAALELDSCTYLMLADISEPDDNSLRLAVSEALIVDRSCEPVSRVLQAADHENELHDLELGVVELTAAECAPPVNP